MLKKKTICRKLNSEILLRSNLNIKDKSEVKFFRMHSRCYALVLWVASVFIPIEQMCPKSLILIGRLYRSLSIVSDCH